MNVFGMRVVGVVALIVGAESSILAVAVALDGDVAFPTLSVTV